MTENTSAQNQSAGGETDPRVVVMTSEELAAQGEDSSVESVTDLVEEPAKVMRIGSMVRQLLDEIKAAPLDEGGRERLADVLRVSLGELKNGLAPELGEELDRLIAPFSDSTPSESELRIAQAQLVGWLEGLFHGIQTAIYAQQMAAQAQLEQMRRALPAGPGQGNGQQFDESEANPGSGGLYL